MLSLSSKCIPPRKTLIPLFLSLGFGPFLGWKWPTVENNKGLDLVVAQETDSVHTIVDISERAGDIVKLLAEVSSAKTQTYLWVGFCITSSVAHVMMPLCSQT